MRNPHPILFIGAFFLVPSYPSTAVTHADPPFLLTTSEQGLFSNHCVILHNDLKLCYNGADLICAEVSYHDALRRVMLIKLFHTSNKTEDVVIKLFFV